MTFRQNIINRGALIIAIGLSLAACESAVITGTGSASSIGAAQTPNLLEDADFEAGSTAWDSCSTNGTNSLINSASKGSQAISINDGACLYQSVMIEAGNTYRVACQTKQVGNDWSSATFAMLDQSNSPLVTEEIAIESTAYSSSTATLTAPANASYAEILFYSEESAHIDDCTLQEVTVSLPEVTLANASFDNGLDNWQQCETGSADAANGVATIANGGCVYQTIDVSEAVSLSPANQPLSLTLQCEELTKSGSGHASLIMAYLDDNYQPVATSELAIDTNATSGIITLDAPGNATYAEAMLYSNATTAVGNCAFIN